MITIAVLITDYRSKLQYVNDIGDLEMREIIIIVRVGV